MRIEVNLKREELEEAVREYVAHSVFSPMPRGYQFTAVTGLTYGSVTVFVEPIPEETADVE